MQNKLPKNVYFYKRWNEYRVKVIRDGKTYYQSFSTQKYPNALELALKKREDFIRFGGRGERSKQYISRVAFSNTGFVGLCDHKDNRGARFVRADWRDENGKRCYAHYHYGKIRTRKEALKLAYSHRLLALQRKFKKLGVDVEGVFSE